MTPAVAIFDIGKTNKKLLLFDKDYQLLIEQSIQFDQTRDEDGDPCEDVTKLSRWIRDSVKVISRSDSFDLKAINVAAYGASFVHLSRSGNLLTPLYDYLKTYPPELIEEFYRSVGGKDAFCLQTASPPLASLNSGLQLYRIKRQHPDVFTQVHYSLHLPQYLAWLVTNQVASDITSIGCHTGLWDFGGNKYHHWVHKEGIFGKFPAILPSDQVIKVRLNDKEVLAGGGLHDSSSALIPYLAQFSEPFILLSTGTWNISLNPFNNSPLTVEQLSHDCLCYLDYRGNPVKAARLFAGHEHETQINHLADHFNVSRDHYRTINFDPALVERVSELRHQNLAETATGNLELNRFKDYPEAYHHFVADLVAKQRASTNLIIDKEIKVKRMFVDGGFSGNPVFMNLLALSFPNLEIFAASVPHATALGAALAIHPHWNTSERPPELIKLVRYYK